MKKTRKSIKGYGKHICNFIVQFICCDENGRETYSQGYVKYVLYASAVYG